MVPLRIVAFCGTRRFIIAFTSATLNVVYLFHQIIIAFKVFSEHADAFVRSWQEFTNSFTVNVGLLSGDEARAHYFIPRVWRVGVGGQFEMQFQPLKHHFGDRQIPSNYEVGNCIRELLGM
jgi:hypothetical protein